MVILRDGRKLIGVFRSYDQFGELASSPLLALRSCQAEGEQQALDSSGLFLDVANFLLESTVERLHHRLDFADRDLGE